MTITIVCGLMVGFLTMGAVLNITQVGKERTPLTGGVAALGTVFTALLIVGTLYLAAN